VAQGAIGIERRLDDNQTAQMLAAIHHTPTGQRLAAERAFLAALDGSCETPIAGLAELEGDQIYLRGEVLRPDGSDVIRKEGRAPIADGAALGERIAKEILAEAPADFFEWRT
jgi:hydroxymethylbilane synthase